jgi:hypothetical protein
MDPRV